MNNSAGIGFGKVNLNATGTQIVASFNFADLSSNAVAGHIHNPALPGVNASVLFPMPPPSGTSGAVVDLFFVVTPQQAADLKRGLLYFNIHTSMFPGGEIRGQILPANKFGDFDADGRAELSVFRPSNGFWYTLNPGTNAFRSQQFGLSSAGDRMVPADYDGDGKTDIAVFRDGGANPELAYFFILNSGSNTVRTEQLGRRGDVVAVGDWDGDGKADPAVYRDSAIGSDNYFLYRGSLNNPSGILAFLQWGTAGDKPLQNDYDGDRRMDAAVFRPSNATWYIRNSSDSSVRFDYWGLASDTFVPADYDGDQRADLAVFRGGVWYIKQSTTNQPRYVKLGISDGQTGSG